MKRNLLVFGGLVLLAGCATMQQGGVSQAPSAPTDYIMVGTSRSGMDCSCKTRDGSIMADQNHRQGQWGSRHRFCHDRTRWFTRLYGNFR